MVRTNRIIRLATFSLCLFAFASLVLKINHTSHVSSTRQQIQIKKSRHSFSEADIRTHTYLKKHPSSAEKSIAANAQRSNVTNPHSTKETELSLLITKTNRTNKKTNSAEKKLTTASSTTSYFNTTAENLVRYVTLRPRIKYLKPVSLINALCQVDGCFSSRKIRWRMVTFVKTVGSNIFRRQMIRQTWGSIQYVNGGQFSTIFVLGRIKEGFKNLVYEEYERYGDMLFIDELDDYQNVPLKTLAGMQWASELLNDNMFYSSCDDDMIVDVGEIQEYIDRFVEEKSENKWPEFPIICSYDLWEKKSEPIRDKRHKNYISNEKYRWTEWPKFCLGGMYTTSVRLVKQLYQLSRTEALLNTDDVWITGVLRNILGMPIAMLIKPEPALAQHMHFGVKFDNDKIKGRLMFEWRKINDKLKSKTICRC